MGRRDFSMHNSKEKIIKVQSKPNYKNTIILEESQGYNEKPLAIVECSKSVVKFDKPIYLGLAI